MFFRSVLFLFLCSAFGSAAHAQRRALNLPEHDNKPYYFGTAFGLNFSQYRIRYTDAFAQTDTFYRIQPYWAPSFALGIMGNLRINRLVDLRFIPSIVFSEKRLVFSKPFSDTAVEDRSIEAVLLHLPLQAKFKSDRIRNFRFYGMAGTKFDIDLAANARSRRQGEFIKVTPFDAGYEVGFGFEFYNPNFIFSPEIKLSQGLKNQLFTGDRTLPLVNAIDELNTRMIMISVFLEG